MSYITSAVSPCTLVAELWGFHWWSLSWHENYHSWEQSWHRTTHFCFGPDILARATKMPLTTMSEAPERGQIMSCEKQCHSYSRGIKMVKYLSACSSECHPAFLSLCVYLFVLHIIWLGLVTDLSLKIAGTVDISRYVSGLFAEWFWLCSVCFLRICRCSNDSFYFILQAADNMIILQIINQYISFQGEWHSFCELLLPLMAGQSGLACWNSFSFVILFLGGGGAGMGVHRGRQWRVVGVVA